MKMKSRRKFLLQSVAAIAGSAMAWNGFPAIKTQKKNSLGVALVGLGYYSTDLLAPALQRTKNCHLAGIVTGTPSKAESWKKQYRIADKNIYNYSNFDRIADNPDVDVIYVVLPPSMHAEYSIRAAKAGKHVWCEKPMAVTAEECTKMIDAAKANKVSLAIGYRMQHEPNTQEIIGYRKQLAYGRILNVKAAAGYFDPRTDHWKQKKAMGGGCMHDMGVYPLNAARYCTGLEPVSVKAVGSSARPEIYKDVPETVVFDLEFPGGVTAHCETSLGKNYNDLRVTCEKGWYGLSPFQSYSGIEGETSSGKRLNAVIPNQQARQMDEDALAIMNSRPMLVPGEEGWKDIRVVDAIYRSIASGKREFC